MGTYLNPNNIMFKNAVTRKIYVDKSLLIEYTNYTMDHENKYICVSRPRRFGKSTDVNMLVAYYSKGCDSKDLFKNLKISQSDVYDQHLNQHHVIYLNMQDFLSITLSIDDMLELLSEELIGELEEYFHIEKSRNILSLYLSRIFSKTKEQFIFIIDEWDCIFREYSQDKAAQKKYLDFLKNILKDKPYVELAYMTGILPIKKYGTHSALNMFDEVSMISPKKLSHFMGFTEKEVKDLCLKYQMNFEELKTWYDGYHLGDTSLYSPRSIVASLTNQYMENYWNDTETYEALKKYIDMNFDGLKDDVIRLLNNEKVSINTSKFQNDMTTFHSKDDVMTLLIHLGYLGYDMEEKEVYIPNKEVTDSFVNSIEESDWQETTKALNNSKALLEATWNMDEKKVAFYIQQAHLETAMIQYNDENALSYTLSLAYYRARDYYKIIREMPSGKGYADLVFLPKKDKPALIVELKWKKDVKTAIEQIKNKEYIQALEGYRGEILLVGISYHPHSQDREYKKHECIIEKWNV